MIVTPFGELEYGSNSGLGKWLAAHDVRHRTYRLEISRRGSTLSAALLTGDVRSRWILVHYLQHAALIRYMQPDSTAMAQVLSADPWKDEESFYRWHRVHNLLHTRLDQSLGVLEQ